MKVSVELSEEFYPPFAIVYAHSITDEIQRAIDLLGAKEVPLMAQQEEKIVFIQPDEVYMVSVMGGDTVIYTEKEKFVSKKRLYEILHQLGGGFLQISKQTIVNLSFVRSVEAGFNGTLFLKLKNGISDYVSRKYLPEFKKYLGI